ncbi:MAG: endonuclease/exonuclease/phosphatase family protein [Kofleriaceae bacterium]
MKRWWLVAGAAIIAVVMLRGGHDRPAHRIATFNIEHFPKSPRQVAGAFDEIVATGASVIAAQEITDPALFVATARQRLGPDWDFAHDRRRVDNHHHIGVLFDRSRWRFVSSQNHDGTRLGPLDLPALEVRLADASTELRIFVVHLRPLTSGRGVRARQHAVIADLAAAARAPGAEVIVLGDFNATEPGDREDLAALAAAAGLTWASESLACSAFWNRPDGCPRSRLDHVLTTSSATHVTVFGGCARDGCDRQDSCPIYEAEVSDHCPVVVDF